MDCAFSTCDLNKEYVRMIKVILKLSTIYIEGTAEKRQITLYNQGTRNKKDHPKFRPASGQASL